MQTEPSQSRWFPHTDEAIKKPNPKAADVVRRAVVDIVTLPFRPFISATHGSKTPAATYAQGELGVDAKRQLESKIKRLSTEKIQNQYLRNLHSPAEIVMAILVLEERDADPSKFQSVDEWLSELLRIIKGNSYYFNEHIRPSLVDHGLMNDTDSSLPKETVEILTKWHQGLQGGII